MAITQLKYKNTNRTNLVKLFHALSDETRLAIVQRLGSGEKCVCDLQDLLDAAQSRLSYHLKLLKDAGLIADRREGRWIQVSIDELGGTVTVDGQPYS